MLIILTHLINSEMYVKLNFLNKIKISYTLILIKKNEKFNKLIQKLNLFVIQKLDNNYFS